MTGFIVGVLSLGAYPLLFAATPLVPLLISAATAIPSKARPFAVGALAASIVGFIALLILMGFASTMTSGTEHYGR